MARFSQAFLQGLLQPTYQQGLFEAARSVGQTPGIMRMQKEQEQQRQQLSNIYGAAISPDATSQQMTQAAQQLLQMGKTEEAIALANQARERKLSEAEKEQMSVLKNSVASQAESMGLTDLARQARLVTSIDRLQALQDQLNERQMETMPELSEKGRRRVLLNVGYSPAFVGQLDLKGMSKQEFQAYKDLQKGDVQMFVDDQGNTGAYKVTDNGMIVINGVLTDPQTAGLREAPNESIIKNVTGTMGEKLATLGAESFADLMQQAKKSEESIRSINNVIGDVDTMFTGTLANINLQVSKFMKSVGIPVDDLPIEQTEVFLAESAKRVADYITNLGSGTGLSDKDLAFTRQVVAGDVTLDANTIKRMLNEYREAAARKINSYNNVRTSVKSKLGAEQESALVFYPPVIVPEFTQDDEFAGFSIVPSQGAE